jgi:Rrf2 family protein
MKFSSRSEYGTRALLDLALHYGEGPVQSAEIAARQEIPENYLNQLLVTLRKAGFIRSLRGPQGGHLLAKPPEKINLGEVISVLDGSTAPMSCADMGMTIDCEFDNFCVLRDVWCRVKEAIDQVLNSTSLDDLCKSYREREQLSHGLMYYI